MTVNASERIVSFTEARDAEEERTPDTMTTKHTASQYLALAFACRLAGDSEGLVKKNQKRAARRGEPLTVTRREEYGNFTTSATTYARFVAATQDATLRDARYLAPVTTLASVATPAPAISEMERIARIADSMRPAGCKQITLG